MGPNLSALILILAGLALSMALLPVRQLLLPNMWAYVLWTALAAALILLANQPLTLLIAFFLLLVAAPMAPVRRLTYFFILVCAIPDYLAAFLPFPGLHQLTEVTYYKLAVTALLVPALLTARIARPTASGVATLVFLSAFAFYGTVVVSASVGIVAGLRFLIDQVLLLILPLAAMALIKTEEDFYEVLKGLLVASVALAGIAAITTLKQWEFYRIHEPISGASILDFRSGFLRIELTANTHSLGWHFVVGLFALEILRRKFAIGFVRTNAMRSFMLLGLLATDSRGALVGGILAVAVMAFLALRSPVVRSLLIAVFAAAVVGGGVWLAVGDAGRLDPYGSFQYRQQLILTSLSFLQDHLVFGDFLFLQSGYFDHLIQGQQIVDVTNLYLQIALPFGLLGFSLFFGAIGPAVWSLFWASSGTKTDMNGPGGLLSFAQRTVLGALVGWLALVATTSNVALTIHLGLILLGLGEAAVRLLRQRSQSPAGQTSLSTAARPSIVVSSSRYSGASS